ncbi:hypothetical protein HRR81_003497 [Exophiala dermatitidis]|nr:hypothetical protein HRR73_001728 [Exophiala dermatitidis]KAJ4546842.1 hypothetical protein HRR77_004387 [Exophiala dermatitidis]KAJ4577043.1 hypothetical protein HRR81_003497 [Exophiala dermatitidis]KAJ4627260.1 hypothetical protein HRR88_003768 [Exophiala dermatitidis]KAJ4630902.1 hypothetical protein HRR86_002443 [Exophiala dermatitidis]
MTDSAADPYQNVLMQCCWSHTFPTSATIVESVPELYPSKLHKLNPYHSDIAASFTTVHKSSMLSSLQTTSRRPALKFTIGPASSADDAANLDVESAGWTIRQQRDELKRRSAKSALTARQQILDQAIQAVLGLR